MTFYVAILHGRSYERGVVETTLLIFGVSILLYMLGMVLGKVFGLTSSMP